MVVLTADLMDSMFSCRYKNLRDASVNVEGQEIQQPRAKVRNFTAQGCFLNLKCQVADLGGTRDADALTVQLFSISRSFWLKLCQIIGCCSPLCVWHPPWFGGNTLWWEILDSPLVFALCTALPVQSGSSCSLNNDVIYL